MKRFLCLSVLGLLAACDPKPSVAPASGALDLAREKIAAKDLPGAIAVLEEARARTGDEPQIVKGLMELYVAQKDPSRAMERGRKALEAHPEWVELYLPLANIYVESAAGVAPEIARTTLLDPARKLLLEGRARGLSDKDTALVLGTCLARLGDVAGARAEFERCAAAGGDERTALFNIALLALQQEDVAGAHELFRKYVEKFPDSNPGKRELARLDLQQQARLASEKGTFDTAVVKRATDVLWDLKDVLPNDWRVHEGLGDGWMLQGDFTAALVSYTEALRLGQNPKSVEERYRAAKQRADAAAAAAGGGAAETPR